MWYRTGTISLTNGSTAVTGSGTAWIANAGIGEAIYGPDGKLYEIAAIVSNTSITLASAYLGTTASGQSYVIVPSQSYIRDLANQAAELINSYAETEATIGQGLFPDGSSSSPSVKFTTETNTGFYKSATNEVTYVANGTAQFKYNLSGLTILTNFILPSATTPSQTAEGSVVWDSDSDLLTVGTGSGRKTMVDTDSTQTLTNKTLASPTLSNPLISGTIAADTLTLSGNTTVGDNSSDVMTVNATATFNTPTVIAANASSSALRITQTGSGNALVVEDSANPDSTPFVIDANGNFFKGYTSSISVEFPMGFQINGTAADSGISQTRWANNTGSPTFYLAKSRGSAVATRGIVQNGDPLGFVQFAGDDGANFVVGANIHAVVDGTPGTNDMPGRLVFSTTADGASIPTERMRINSNGGIGIGGSAFSDSSFRISRSIQGSTSSYGVFNDGQISSGVTANATYFQANSSTQAASFTLSNLYYYGTYQGAIGAGSTVTNQYGFFVNSALTGATNNYGFYSNIASGTGRYNFYAAGSADNYFAGSVGVGVLPPGATSSRLFVGGDVTLTNTNTVLFSNLYYASGFKYVGNGYGAYIKLAGSSATVFEFGIAGSNSSGAGAAATAVIALNIDQSGNVLIPGPGGLGYGTGSGGAVTQTTSRTTGVTLNKTNGAITLVSAAGSATYQSFTVTNSTVAATDTIIINQKSGTDLYEIHITAVAAGSFRVSFKTTGGTTTEQPVFNFAVIKAVTA